MAFFEKVTESSRNYYALKLFESLTDFSHRSIRIVRCDNHIEFIMKPDDEFISVLNDLTYYILPYKYDSTYTPIELIIEYVWLEYLNFDDISLLIGKDVQKLIKNWKYKHKNEYDLLYKYVEKYHSVFGFNKDTTAGFFALAGVL